MAQLHFLEKEFILDNYSLFGPKVVSEKLNRSSATIIKFAKSQNLELDRTKKLPEEDCPDFKYDLVFYNRFLQELTPELAYWLGFFWADGTVNRETSLVIEITQEDGEQLKDMFSNIFPFSISYRERAGRKPQMSFYITDKKVASLLKSLGKYPKSRENHEKIFNYLNSDELQLYFLRGLIDGDGSFYLNEKDKYGQFTLASNINQDWSYLQEYLKEFNPHISITEKKSGNSSVFRITGRSNIISFINYLKYDSIKIGLDRKIKNALNIIEMYNNTPEKSCKKVYQYTMKKEFIQEFSSINDASNKLNIGVSSIRNCLCGISNSAGGYIWSYKPLIIRI